MVKMTVKQARRYRDITTTDMAEALGISRITYEKKEKNPKKFTVEQAEKISKVVEMPKSQILFVE
jgi:DNA-binding XRE family transcriptional regulator